jgi:hypothetical protein
MSDDAPAMRRDCFDEFPETIEGDASPEFRSMAMRVHPDQDYSSASTAMLCRRAYDLGRMEERAAALHRRLLARLRHLVGRHDWGRHHRCRGCGTKREVPKGIFCKGTASTQANLVAAPKQTDEVAT